MLLLFSTADPLVNQQLVNEALIRHYSLVYEVNADLMVAIAKAESNLITTAKNPTSSASGLYQWIASSWNSVCKPLGFQDVFNPKENIECAVITVKNGGLRHWNESRSIWQFELSSPD